VDEHNADADRSWNPTWTLVVASLALMMAFLDSLVVTTALPTLRVSLHSSLTTLEWTVNAYNLSFACLLLTGAALGDRFGRRRMLCTGLAIFTGASLLAGLAPTIGVLVAARAMQGAGSAIMVPLTLTLVTGAYPPGRRGWAIGIWGGVGGLSGAIGPFVGGAVVQAIGWHWIFWINLPVGLALIPIALLRVRESSGGHPRLDILGVGLATTGLFGITWAVVRTNTTGWGSSEVIATLIAGLAVVGLFVLWERPPRQPAVHARRPGDANGGPRVPGGHRPQAYPLPRDGPAAAHRRRRHRNGVPHRRERGHGVCSPARDRHRRRNQQCTARARRRFRHRRARLRLQPTRRLQLTRHVRRGLPIRALGRRRILGGRDPPRTVPQTGVTPGRPGQARHANARPGTIACPRPSTSQPRCRILATIRRRPAGRAVRSAGMAAIPTAMM
jgi:Major Facilitator Superfamily